MTGPSHRPRLTIVCESYWPELTSTAQLITELAEGLAPDFRVEVLTTQPRFNSKYEKQPKVEDRNGVRVHRLPATSFPKESRAGRLINWLSFLGSVCLAVFTRWRRRTYLYLTNPPTAPWAALLTAAMRQPAYVLVYDLYPDLAEAIGAVRKGGLVARAFDAVNKLAFRRATGLIALGQDMRARLQEKLGADAEITVIPNWANGDLISPRPKSSSAFATSHGLQDTLVFLYAGNLGLFQDLETLAEAASSLPGGKTRGTLVFVGDGGKRRKVEAMAANSDKVKVFDYVPYEELGDLYAAADVGLIALEPGVEKSNVPSKTYSILAAGKPFIAVSDGSTDLTALAEQGCGVCVPNDVSKVAEAMRRFVADPDAARAMGRRARDVFESRYSRPATLARYRQLFLDGEAGAASPQMDQADPMRSMEPHQLSSAGASRR